MNLLHFLAESLQVKVFRKEEELNAWLKEQKETQVIDVKFTSVVLPDGTIKDRFLVIYKKGTK